MSRWIRLVDMVNGRPMGLQRGDLLKFPASYPFEEMVVMMVCGNPMGDRMQGRALITISGFKAGINPYVIFPEECGGVGVQLSVEWITKNWDKWVWPGGDVSNVWARSSLEASEL